MCSLLAVIMIIIIGSSGDGSCAPMNLGVCIRNYPGALIEEVYQKHTHAQTHTHTLTTIICTLKVTSDMAD